MKSGALGVLVAGGLLGFGFWALMAQAQTRQGTTTVDRPGRSVARRVADVIATRDPQAMREVAEELEREGHREAAEGLRMTADITESQLQQGVP